MCKFYFGISRDISKVYKYVLPMFLAFSDI